MKLGKKATIALSFIAGACLFFTTALADMTLGTGYDRLKEAAKRTSAQMENGLDSYTLESVLSTKLNGTVMYESKDLLKVDTINRVSETLNEHTRYNEDKYTWYTYNDETTYAYKSSEDDQFYVAMRTRKDWTPFSDPFREEITADMERIVDALVGNLKDSVMVEEAANGGKIYSGSLSEVQVPTLVNAVLSLLFKQTSYDWFGGYRNEDIPRLSEDIYVSRISGRAEEDETGLLKNVTGEIILLGATTLGRDLAGSIATTLATGLTADCTELNIDPEGNVDWPGEFLATFDLCIASVHSHFTLPRAEMTRRLVRACENPYVTILGHPTARLIGSREPIDADWDEVFRACARTRTVLEIDAFPDRLDLPADLIRRALAHDVLFAVDSDAHAVPHLDVMRYGVGTAQRGWLTADRVINTWPVDRLLEFLRSR